MTWPSVSEWCSPDTQVRGEAVGVWSLWTLRAGWPTSPGTWARPWPGARVTAPWSRPGHRASPLSSSSPSLIPQFTIRWQQLDRWIKSLFELQVFQEALARESLKDQRNSLAPDYLGDSLCARNCRKYGHILVIIIFVAVVILFIIYVALGGLKLWLFASYFF